MGVYKRKYTCSRCGEPGHNRQTCGVATTARAPSRSVQAADWLQETGATTRDAALKFGISHQAVIQGWAQRYPGESVPSVAGRAAVATQIEALARSGLTAREIADETGASRTLVYRICRVNAIAVATSYDEATARNDAALARVAAGSTVIDAAMESGVSVGHLGRLMRDAGIRSKADPKACGRHDGRSARASALVDAGMSLADAARAERVAPSAVTIYRRRHGLRPPMTPLHGGDGVG